MIKQDSTISRPALFFAQSQTEQLSRLPKRSSLKAVRELSKLFPSLEVDYNQLGEICSLSGTSGLSKPELSENPTSLAERFLTKPLIKSAFTLSETALLHNKTRQFPFGHRVDFKQVGTIAGIEEAIPIHGGAISVLINKDGQVFSVNSTLQHGHKLRQAGRIISHTEAQTKAAEQFRLPVSVARSKLVLSNQQGKMQLAYEVSLESETPRDIVSYLVLAKTGQVVEAECHLLKCCVSQQSAGLAAKVLLCTPNPSKRISLQVSRAIISSLPNPRILKNEYFAMFIGRERQAVFAKQDGSYCYNIKDPEFAAVSVFMALNRQLKLYINLGMNPPERVIPIYVNDPSVKDNAYFDPVLSEMHIGVGSGLKHKGLRKRIAFDLGVSNHEFGHSAVYLQTPGNDLPGKEGSALHEAMGDVLGTLVMDYLCRIWYAKDIGGAFSAADVVRDGRIIGRYAASPNGIRVQRNTKRMPDDMVGEPHTDGLIVGGALADLLESIATLPGTKLEDQIKLFAKINLMALALVPIHQVTFRDMLRALILADYHETGSELRELIENSFAAHGIALGAMISRRTMAAKHGGESIAA